MSCRDGIWRWNGRTERFHARDYTNPDPQDGYCFQAWKKGSGIAIDRCDNLVVTPTMALQRDYFSSKNQLPQPRPGANYDTPLGIPEIDSYSSLCNRGYPSNPSDFGDPNSINGIDNAVIGLKLEARRQVFRQVCGCTAKKFPFAACPGVAYYPRWKYRTYYHVQKDSSYNYDSNEEGIIEPADGWIGAQVVNEGTDQAYITNKGAMYAPIVLLGY